jgi:hypothetical protein
MREPFDEAKIASWHAMIGKKVWKNPKTTSKFEPKPFKSGLKMNTVKGVCIHDRTTHLAFTFEEDASHVECFRCSLAPENRYEPETAEQSGQES